MERVPQRVSVVGTTGTGKTTFAAGLAAVLGCPHVELDRLHWEPGWQPAPVELFRERVLAATAGACWVVDGNYRQVRDLVWERADTVVWLDFSLPLMLWRILSRTGRRVFSREELWNGNRESLRLALSRDSILWWQLKTYRSRRREFPQLVADSRWAHLDAVTLRSPADAQRWLDVVRRAVAVS